MFESDVFCDGKRKRTQIQENQNLFLLSESHQVLVHEHLKFSARLSTGGKAHVYHKVLTNFRSESQTEHHWFVYTDQKRPISPYEHQGLGIKG